MSPNQVWVITGVSTGLGYALALYVASLGNKVVGTVRSLSTFPEQLRSAGVVPLVVDLDQPDDKVRKAGEAAVNLLGNVDVLVNNAGRGIIRPVEESTLSDFRAVFQTNFFGLLAFTQPFITHFRTRRTGHIVNISSMAGSVAFPSLGAYCASKAALNILGDILSLELKLFGVRVLNIQPGVFPSAIWDKVINGNVASASLADGGSTDDSPTRQPTTVYTDPTTQGSDIARRLLENARESGQIGDPRKYAQRVHEMVTGTGLAEEVAARSEGNGKWDGPWELNRVPLGTDCLTFMKSQLTVLEDNLRAFEAIACSTDVEETRL